ncbi:MAG TPA: Sec-independent protein translocase protein TatB [Methyloceanibacter sp.]|jgi:sec-independent protein translocase protein TatB|nr:Sec-independent protein translocase protein TatB [Methyloceanibacter sp.]
MFDIGWSELLVIGVVAIIVVGPKDLPKLMRGIGFYAGKLRRAATDFQRQFEEAMRESEMEEVRKSIESVKVEGRPFDQPVMLPKPQSEAKPEAAAKPKPKQARKPGAAKSKPKSRAKPKTASAKRGKKSDPAP